MAEHIQAQRTREKSLLKIIRLKIFNGPFKNRKIFNALANSLN